jgi:hypothetical protein
MTRRTTAVLVLALWVGALGWLAEREYLQEHGLREDQPRWPVPPGNSFYAVRLNDRQVGLASFTVDTLPEGLRTVELLTIDLPPIPPARLRRTSYRIVALYSRALQLRAWQSDLLSEDGRMTSTGQVTGDSLLTVINLPRGEPAETLHIALRRPVVLPGALPLVAASRGLPKPGSKLNVEVYDPLDQEVRVDRVVIAAESVLVVPDSAVFSSTLRRWTTAHSDTVRAWRLDGYEQGLPFSRWIDASGMMVRTVRPLGAVIERSAFELVQTNFRNLPAPLWDTASAAPDYLPDDTPSGVRTSLTVLARVGSGEPVPGEVPALAGGWQTRSGDTIRVAAPVASDSAPETGGPVWFPGEPDSSIAAQARRLVGKQSRPQAAALALTDWVARTITLHEGPGTPTPARTLARRQGNAEARVVLLASLARAAGLPARLAWGLVRVHGRWQLRPWAEVWAGGGWMPLDPATGKRGIDAGRVRLATGGMDRMLELAIRAGRLRLDVLEEKR